MTTVINLRDTAAVRAAKAAGVFVRIDRASLWGNPYHIGQDGDRADVIAKYEALVLSDADTIKRIRRTLRGKTLGCHCAPLACHGDVLARIADGGE